MAPQFVVAIQPVVTKEKETVTLVAKVTGTPAPEVTWFHDNEPIKSDDIYTITPGPEGQSSLEIAEVYPEDAGEYTVKATNKAGVSAITANVIVQGRSRSII